MCVKLSPKDLNPDLYPLHPTSIYTYRVTIAPRVCDGSALSLLLMLNWSTNFWHSTTCLVFFSLFLLRKVRIIIIIISLKELFEFLSLPEPLHSHPLQHGGAKGPYMWSASFYYRRCRKRFSHAKRRELKLSWLSSKTKRL